MKNIDAKIQKLICSLIDWREEDYYQFIYDCGEKYLHCCFPDYPQVNNEIIRSQNFWNWWKYHWENRDSQFIEQWEGITSEASLKSLYLNHHDARTLARAIYPNGMVLRETYLNLIKLITKEQNQKLKSYA